MPGFLDAELVSDSSSDSECMQVFIYKKVFSFYLVWRLFTCPLLVLNPLLAHLYISYHITPLFRRNSVLLTGYHAAPVVTLSFSHAHVTCMALHHTVVISYSPSVINRTLYHASGHLVLYSECYGFERERFLLSGAFYLALLPAFSKLP